MSSHSKAETIAKDIKLLILDVDGVLTDGGIYFDDNGTEHKKFDSQDGCGIKLLELCGVEVAIIAPVPIIEPVMIRVLIANFT